MTRFKSFCLVLCCCLVCLNGFSPVVSYAYGESDNSYTYEWDGQLFSVIYDMNDSFSKKYVDYSDTKEENFFKFDNAAFSDSSYDVRFGVMAEWDSISSTLVDAGFDFEYLPEVYDYYIVASMIGDAISALDFTFSPETFGIFQFGHSGSANVQSVMSLTFNKYCYCGYAYKGWTVTAKMPELSNMSITHLMFRGTGTIPENMKFKASIVRVDKGESITDELQTIIEQLTKLDATVAENGQIISDAITEQGTNIVSKIEEQYAVSEEEDFGVNDIVNQVNEKAGVLAFGTTTLVNFLDLFDASNATSTELTFPGFSINVQGVNYQVWNNITYDLSELESQFGALLEVVRWGCTMVVYLAVLNYLVHAYEEIFGG